MLYLHLEGSDTMVTVWFAAAAVFLIVEAVTAAMSSIWFVAGSLAALAAAALGAALWVQILLFAGVSGLCLALLYPRLKDLLRRNRQPTNADMVIGRQCVVTQRIDNLAGTGAVFVDGKTWTARSAAGEVVEEGAVVTAQDIEGVKLIVSPARQTQSAGG